MIFVDIFDIKFVCCESSSGIMLCFKFELEFFGRGCVWGPSAVCEVFVARAYKYSVS